jgi:hypothetical protein
MRTRVLIKNKRPIMSDHDIPACRITITNRSTEDFEVVEVKGDEYAKLMLSLGNRMMYDIHHHSKPYGSKGSERSLENNPAMMAISEKEWIRVQRSTVEVETL